MSQASSPGRNGSSPAPGLTTPSSAAAEKTLRILLLEDNTEDAALIRRQLDKEMVAYISRTVSAWPEFESAIEQFKPDLVLSDYKLAGFTGLDALAFSRSLLPDLPFILVTGALGEELAAQTIKQGAT